MNTGTTSNMEKKTETVEEKMCTHECAKLKERNAKLEEENQLLQDQVRRTLEMNEKILALMENANRRPPSPVERIGATAGDDERPDMKCTFCGEMDSECGGDHGDEMREIGRMEEKYSRSR